MDVKYPALDALKAKRERGCWLHTEKLTQRTQQCRAPIASINQLM